MLDKVRVFKDSMAKGQWGPDKDVLEFEVTQSVLNWVQ